MLEFTCSSCGKRVQGDDSFAGKLVLCPHCGKATTARGTTAQCSTGSGSFSEGMPSYASTTRAEPAAPATRKEFPHIAFRWIAGLIVIGIVLACGAFGVLKMQEAREKALRTQSMDNLKQIGLAFLAFDGMNKRLPYNGTKVPYAVDNVMHGGPAIAGDNRTGSWAFMILPFIGDDAIFNTKRTDRGVAVYMCPGRDRPDRCTGLGGPGSWTDYFLNPFLNDPNGAFDVPDTKLTVKNIKDGVWLTVLVGQGQINPNDYGSLDVTPGFTDVIFNGGSPGLCRPNRDVRNAPDSSQSLPGNWGGPFSFGSLMAMGDGRVTWVRYHKGEEGAISDGRSSGTWICGGGGCGGLGALLTPNGQEPGGFFDG